MNPKDFTWKQDQQVTVTNPTENDFKFKVHSKEYLVGAGQTAKMPGYIAWVYVHKLATQMAQKDNAFIHWNEEGFRQKYYEKIAVGADDIVQSFTPEPQVEPLSDTVEETSTESSVKPMRARRGQSSNDK